MKIAVLLLLCCSFGVAQSDGGKIRLSDTTHWRPSLYSHKSLAFDWTPKWTLSGYTWNPDSEKPVMFWPQFFKAWDEWKDSCWADSAKVLVPTICEYGMGCGVYHAPHEEWRHRSPDNLSAFMDFIKRRKM